jgi:hypothetical protein
MKFDWKGFLRPSKITAVLFIALLIAGGWFGFGLLDMHARARPQITPGIEFVSEETDMGAQTSFGFPFTYKQECLEYAVLCNCAAFQKCDCPPSGVKCGPVNYPLAAYVGTLDVLFWFLMSCLLVLAYNVLVKK